MTDRRLKRRAEGKTGALNKRIDPLEATSLNNNEVYIIALSLGPLSESSFHVSDCCGTNLPHSPQLTVAEPVNRLTVMYV